MYSIIANVAYLRSGAGVPDGERFRRIGYIEWSDSPARCRIRLYAFHIGMALAKPFNQDTPPDVSGTIMAPSKQFSDGFMPIGHITTAQVHGETHSHDIYSVHIECVPCMNMTEWGVLLQVKLNSER